MKTIQGFDEHVRHQLYVGDELERAAAVQHYQSLCSFIESSAGQSTPYLITPMRLLIVSLEVQANYGEALQFARRYEKLVEAHLFIDRLAILDAKLLVARLLSNLGRNEEALSISNVVHERLEFQLQDNRRRENQKQ